MQHAWEHEKDSTVYEIYGSLGGKYEDVGLLYCDVIRV
jgi:hypothetical protein